MSKEINKERNKEELKELFNNSLEISNESIDPESKKEFHQLVLSLIKEKKEIKLLAEKARDSSRSNRKIINNNFSSFSTFAFIIALALSTVITILLYKTDGKTLSFHEAFALACAFMVAVVFIMSIHLIITICVKSDKNYFERVENLVDSFCSISNSSKVLSIALPIIIIWLINKLGFIQKIIAILEKI